MNYVANDLFHKGLCFVAPIIFSVLSKSNQSKQVFFTTIRFLKNVVLFSGKYSNNDLNVFQCIVVCFYLHFAKSAKFLGKVVVNYHPITSAARNFSVQSWTKFFHWEASPEKLSLFRADVRGVLVPVMGSVKAGLHMFMSPYCYNWRRKLCHWASWL